MKTLKRFLLFIAGICLLIACSKSDKFWGDEPLGNTLKNGKAEPVMVTVPFKADFVLGYTDMFVNEDMCNKDDPWNNNDPVDATNPILWIVTDGSGTGTHMGNFTSHCEFCCNTFTGRYGNASGVFIAANGDKLFWDNWGQVVMPEPGDPDHYINKWNDPWKITGGTGRFKGATGSGMTHSYNTTLDDVSHHSWTGTITLVHGKQ